MIIGGSPPYLSHAFVRSALRAMNATVRITVSELGGPIVSGFLLTPDLVLTEGSFSLARESVEQVKIHRAQQEPSSVRDAWMAGTGRHRFTLLRLASGLDTTAPRPASVLSPEIVSIGTVAISHYPLGGPEVVLSVGQIHALEGDELLHTGSTEPGSGGGPVLDFRGDVCGIHFARDSLRRLNRAMRMDRLIAALAEAFPALWEEVRRHHGLAGELGRIIETVTDTEAETARLAHLRAASVLWSFDPATLAPFPPLDHPRTARSLLADDAVTVGSGETQRWMLHDDARLQGLRALGTLHDMRRARERNTVPSEGAQLWLDRCLFGDGFPAWTAASTEELTWLKTSAEWLAPYLPAPPPVALLERTLALRRLVEPFAALAGPHFRGREPELEALAAHVIRPTQPERALLVHGTGGAGKSSLLGRFVMKWCAPDRSPRIPFAVLDFDRAVLEPGKPEGVYRELIRQLRLQLPADALAEDLPANVGTVAGLIDRLCRLEKASSFLLAVDSFEQVQYRMYGDAPELAWIDALLAEAAQVRVVILGRASAERLVLGGAPVRALPLGPLDVEAADGALERLGVTEPRAREVLIRAARGNPLTLRVGARFLAGQSLNELEKALAGLPQALVQGVLYERVLERINASDPRVAKLAKHGLVLRRLEIEMLTDVLAPVAMVEIAGLEDAAALFQALQRETFLARLESASVLVHRQELRRVTLPLLEENARTLVQTVDRTAADWYAKRSGEAARAEELYHRLRLDDPPATLAALWLPGVAERLRLDPEEKLPERAAAWIHDRLRAHDDHRPATDPLHLEDIQRQAARALALADAAAALRILESVDLSDDSEPVLQACSLKAQALIHLGQLPAAAELAGETEAKAKSVGSADLALRASLLRAWTALEAKDALAEGGALGEAIRRGVPLGDPYDSALGARFWELGQLPPEQREQQLRRVGELFEKGAGSRALVRYALSVTGDHAPLLVARALELWGLEGIDSELLDLPGEAMGAEQEWILRLSAQLVEVPVQSDPKETWRAILRAAKEREVGPRLLADLCFKLPPVALAFARGWAHEGRRVLYPTVLNHQASLLEKRVSLLSAAVVDSVVDALAVLPQPERVSADLRLASGVGAPGWATLPGHQLEADFRTLVHGEKASLTSWLSAAEAYARGVREVAAADAVKGALKTFGVFQEEERDESSR